jgi:ADP-heptose:LPS heptosyltransferase
VNVLLIQLRQLGDVLLSSPLARVIKEEIPGSQVHFLTSEYGSSILKNNPFIDKVISIEKGFKSELKALSEIRRQKYDAVIDIQRTGRSKRLTLLSGAEKRVAFRKERENFYYNVLIDWVNRGYTTWERMELLKGIGIENKKMYLPQIYLTEEELKRGKGFLEEYKLEENGFFVVVPTSRRREKSWESEKFGKLSGLVGELRGEIPLFAYAPGEKELALKAFKRCGIGRILKKPVGIRELASIISHASFFIGNDSFASHLAFSLGKKTAVIMGPYEGWFPDSENVIRIKKGLHCQPCGNLKKCEFNLACYRELSPEEAFEQLKEHLNFKL